MTLLRAALCVAGGLLTGCSILNPYDSEFACPGTTDYGKCTSVQGAYSEALGGVAPDTVSHAKRKDDETAQAASAQAEGAERAASVNRYKAAEYSELAKVIEMPVTPIVTPPKILRTLVMAYATGEKTLYMPRFIFYFANDGTFVLGDYLSAEKPMESQTLYPNGR